MSFSCAFSKMPDVSLRVMNGYSPLRGLSPRHALLGRGEQMTCVTDVFVHSLWIKSKTNTKQVVKINFSKSEPAAYIQILAILSNSELHVPHYA